MEEVRDEQTSQKLRKITARLDPFGVRNRMEAGGSQPQIMIEVHSETSHVRKRTSSGSGRRGKDRVLQRQVVSELVISVRISVMEKHRDMMESTIHCPSRILMDIVKISHFFQIQLHYWWKY